METDANPSVREVGAHPQTRGGARGRHRRGVRGSVKVSGEQHHIVLNIFLQVVRERQAEYII